MTIEEAIEILEKELIKSYRNNLYQNADKIDREEALEMAIDALRIKQDMEHIVLAYEIKEGENE